VIVVAVAARGSGRSACGEVGDRERVASPDGRRTAFVRCTAEGSAWLYISAGGGERRLAPGDYGCCYRPSSRVVFRAPAWSPDGRRLAVVIEDVGGTDVWTLEADGSRARRVTTGPAVERAPRWSPDGRTIAFRTETGSLASIAVPGATQAR
jgi:Tol biopolymer transport system component